MANCFNCKNAYIEDIWNEWDCRKAAMIRDEDGLPSDEEFECEHFEDAPLMKVGDKKVVVGVIGNPEQTVVNLIHKSLNGGYTND